MGTDPPHLHKQESKPMDFYSTEEIEKTEKKKNQYCSGD